MQRIRSVAAPDAHFGVSALVHTNQRRGHGALGYEEFKGAFGECGVLGRQGLCADAPVDERIPLDAVVKYALCDDAGAGVPGLSFGFDDGAQVTVGQLWGRLAVTPNCARHQLGAGDYQAASAAPRWAPALTWCLRKRCASGWSYGRCCLPTLGVT